MNSSLLTTFVAMTLVGVGQCAKEIPGFTFIGSVTSGAEGEIGTLSVSNLYVSQDMATQENAKIICELIGPNSSLMTIPDSQKERQVLLHVRQAKLNRVWTSGSYYNGRWVWSKYDPISPNSSHWYLEIPMPTPRPDYGVIFRVDNEYDFGLQLSTPRTALRYICESPSD